MVDRFDQLLAKHPIPKLDIGCGQSKNPGFIGIDYEAFEGVDIVHNVEKFPWPIPDNTFYIAVASHLVEHINPTPGDNRVVSLVELLLKKGLITPEEVQEYIGELNPGPIFMRFMDEVWRILKEGGEFAMAYPYAGSPGFWQDPTHINGITEMTWWYFDPEEPRSQGALYAFYKPKPWKIVRALGQKSGNMEVVLQKRPLTPEYLSMDPNTIFNKQDERRVPIIDGK